MKKPFPNRRQALLDVISAYGLGLWDLSGGVLHLDQKAGEIIGVGEKEIKQETFLHLIHESERPCVAASLERLLAETGSCASCDYRILYRGAYRWVRSLGKSYLRDSQKFILGTTQILEGTALEFFTSQINSAAEELAKKEKLYRCIFETAEVLLNTGDDNFEQALQASMEIIGTAANLARVYLYKNHLVDGTLSCTEIYEWTKSIEPTLGEEYTTDIPYHSWPGLEETLSRGENYNHTISEISPEIAAMVPNGIKALLLVPVFIRDLLWGFVGYDSGEERRFGANEESVLRSAGLFLANSLIRYDLNKNLYLAVDKINTTSIRADALEKFAYTDGLTGLYNRRHFMELALTSLEKARRFNTSCFAMILDLDFFKKVNDTYGHLAGDEVLKNASSLMKKTLRSYDLLARYGGEEFVVLVTDTDRDPVMNLAERIRESIEKNPCVYGNLRITCTVSIGVAESAPDCSITGLIDLADKALYQAKESGRNRVVFYNPEPLTGRAESTKLK
ncbi:MAG: sensor domain-containing diguanylate cyclase [Treponema sp.]|nr:sensor domain-containing diguanylate cyclase [Treponema sp.]